MAAAVADYTPVERAPQKVTKGVGPITVVLERTADILKELGARRKATGASTVLVGFAAETEEVVARATAKLRAKQVDLIVANDVSRSDAGFESHDNEVTLVAADGAVHVPLQSKTRVAAAILDRIEQLVATRSDAAVKP
jgi:phosphopantothenoylcysteine decarboxylase/phosphopantothenate--cysteine ligase